jgi:hypothetical protein
VLFKIAHEHIAVMLRWGIFWDKDLENFVRQVVAVDEFCTAFDGGIACFREAIKKREEIR